MKRIALLGPTGYIGQKFSQHLKKYDIAVAYINRRVCDLTDFTELKHVLKFLKPHFVINCAGYVGKPNVDACESKKDDCVTGNVVVPVTISNACESLRIPWGHVSSGCIYSGDNGGSGFSEDDPPNFSFIQQNCSFYSGTKAVGEVILDSDPRCYVWRLRIPFDNVDSPRNYLSKVMDYEKLLDVRNSISHTEDFVDSCIQCFLKGVPYGVYNMTNPGSVTTSQVVDMIQHYGLCKDKQFKFYRNAEEFMSTVKAPRSSCVLDTTKQKVYGIAMRNVDEALDASLANWRVESVI